MWAKVAVDAFMNQTNSDHFPGRDRTVRWDNPRAQALFETSADVHGGLITAYDHVEQRSEVAWK